jgi:serine/threonine protein kinase
LQIECPDCPIQLRKYLRDRRVTDPAAIALLEKMFTYDPENRITVKEILEDPYLNDPHETPCLPEYLPKI